MGRVYEVARAVKFIDIEKWLPGAERKMRKPRKNEIVHWILLCFLKTRYGFLL